VTLAVRNADGLISSFPTPHPDCTLQRTLRREADAYKSLHPNGLWLGSPVAK